MTNKNIIYFCSLAITVIIALNCSSGGKSNSPDNLSNGDAGTIEFKLVNKNLNKFASVSSDSIFIISSDLADRADPLEATHVRTRLFSKGKMIVEKIEPILRSNIAPYSIDPTTRFVTITGIANDDYLCTIELGQDFGEDSINRKEIIYYSGQLDNITIFNNEVFLNGIKKSVIEMPVSIAVNRASGAYSIQGFLDFSSIPRIDVTLSAADNLIKKSSQTSLETISSDDSFTFGTINQILKDSDQFQSQFFEIKNIPIIYSSFYGHAESGEPRNFILKTFLNSSESQEGKLILFDWETTFNVIIARWYNYFNLSSTDATLENEQSQMYKVFKVISKLSTEPITGFIETTESELALLHIAYLIAFELNKGKNKSLSPATTFNTAIVKSINTNTHEAMNFFLFSSSNNLRPIKVLVSGRNDPIYFNTKLTSTNNWDPTVNGNTLSNNGSTSNLSFYQTEVQAHFKEEGILNLIRNSIK